MNLINNVSRWRALRREMRDSLFLHLDLIFKKLSNLEQQSKGGYLRRPPPSINQWLEISERKILGSANIRISRMPRKAIIGKINKNGNTIKIDENFGYLCEYKPI